MRPGIHYLSELPKKLTLNKLALIGEAEKARKIKENPIFHLYFLEKYGIIQEKQLTLKH